MNSVEKAADAFFWSGVDHLGKPISIRTGHLKGDSSVIVVEDFVIPACSSFIELSSNMGIV